MEKPVCSMYGVMLMRHLGQSGPLHSTACAVWWPDHGLLHSVGMVRHTVLYCRWACSLGPSSSQCLPVPGGLWQGDGSAAACVWLRRRAFICLPLENRYSSEQELLHGEQCSSLFSDADSVWCRGSYNKSPNRQLWDNLYIQEACSWSLACYGLYHKVYENLYTWLFFLLNAATLIHE